MQRIGLAAIMTVELPDHTARFTDGGTIEIDGQNYSSRDSVLGIPVDYESVTEGVGDEAPGATLGFLPPSGVAASVLNDPAIAKSPVTISIVEFDEDTGAPVGDPDQVAALLIDYPTLSFDDNQRSLDLLCMAEADRLFQNNQGNVLSPSFHERIWPGEKGLANASGTSRSVAWGSASAPRGSSSGGFNGGGSNGGGGSEPVNPNVYQV